MHKKAFSLVEILIGMIVLSCIIAAFAPVITKRSESSNITIVNPSEKEEVQEPIQEERIATKIHEQKQEKAQERMQEREETHVREIDKPQEEKKPERFVQVGGSEQFEALSKVVENCRINLDTSELICDLVESAKGEIASKKD